MSDPELVAALLAKSHRALGAAHRLLEAGEAEATANRSYYAAFYAASAALASQGVHPKTHVGTHRAFRERFVVSGRVPTATGETLPHAIEARLSADYDAFSVHDLAPASDLLRDVAAFVAAVESALGPPDAP